MFRHARRDISSTGYNMGRILAIDVGEKRVGLAVTDDLQIIASPFDVLPNNNELFTKLKNICVEYKVAKLVIGMPYSKKHKEASAMAEGFTESIKQEFADSMGLEIDFQDERNSSVYAETWMKTEGYSYKRIRESSDKYAALKILEDYITRPKE
ncbi:MAG: Holliday junction resolvase RuvX [Brevinematales bacterium]|nr:Holliday junction resolvase RuvX [Brevinematales bacterium]